MLVPHMSWPFIASLMCSRPEVGQRPGFAHSRMLSNLLRTFQTMIASTLLAGTNALYGISCVFSGIENRTRQECISVVRADG
jgi:hypothetical protein